MCLKSVKIVPQLIGVSGQAMRGVVRDKQKAGTPHSYEDSGWLVSRQGLEPRTR